MIRIRLTSERFARYPSGQVLNYAGKVIGDAQSYHLRWNRLCSPYAGLRRMGPVYRMYFRGRDGALFSRGEASSVIRRVLNNSE